MKKRFLMVWLVCFMCLLAIGCSKGGQPQDNAQNGASANGAAMGDAADVDLTVLSSTMVYAEVYNMMSNPEDYMGKTIKISGPYYPLYYDETDQYYHYVIIEDATACCETGLEFVWKGEHSYPGDYPEEETKIEMTGVFGSYEELGETYYYLDVDSIEIL